VSVLELFFYCFWMSLLYINNGLCSFKATMKFFVRYCLSRKY
jgi:hypothetical protein